MLARGDSLVAAGDLAGAEAAYGAAAAGGWTSAALEHNRGLAALRAGRAGEAVAHLLRARRLAPADPSVQQSLAAARAAAGVTATPESRTWRAVRYAARPAGVGGLILLAAMLGTAAVAARRRRPAALALAAGAVLAWAFAAGAWYDAAPRAAVIAPTAVRAAPAAGAAARADLAAGRSVRVRGAHGAWLRVDGGWVAARAVVVN